MLGFHLRHVRLDGGDVLVVDGVLDVRKSAPEYGSADRLHASVHWGRPVLLNFGDQRDPVWQQNFGHIIDEDGANPGVVQVNCRAGGKPCGLANGPTCRTTQQANRTPKIAASNRAKRAPIRSWLL